MPKLLQIAQLGNSVLRKKAQQVQSLNKEIKELVNDMLLTLKDSDGVGIAAPQVYQSKSIIIISCFPSPRYPKAPKMEPLVIINPKIILQSEKTEKHFEGCLSIPGIRAQVSRSIEIEAEFTNKNNKKQIITFKDILARIFLHEYDHLEGIVFLDRADKKDIYTEKEFLRIISKK